MWTNFVVYMTQWSLLLDGEIQTNLYTCANSAKNNSHESFFYNKVSKICILNNAKIHTTNGLVSRNGFIYYVLHGPKCGPPPVIPNAVLKDVVYKSGDVYTASYSCIPGFYFPLIRTSTCSGSTWSSGIDCKVIESCSDLKQCNPAYKDGEYWLYPAVYKNKMAKIYCYGIGGGNPIEYVTLIESNVMEFPLGSYIRGSGCKVKTAGATLYGKVRFHKVRILPESMTIQSNDRRFTTQIYGSLELNYGYAGACSVYDTAICPQRGTARIDVTSTGLIFGASNEWMKKGWLPKFTVVSKTGYKIFVTGDGGCGGGKPKEPIKLELDPSYKPSLNSAINPVCM